MIYRFLADMLVVIHFLWILFMLVGFFLTLWAIIVNYAFHHPSRYLDRWIFRTVHLAGILYVAVIALLGKYCPLTIWEYKLRLQYDPGLSYPGSFIIGYIKKLVFPNVSPLTIFIPTVFIAVFTLAIFVIRPPQKIKRLLFSPRKYS